jgi:hypothetical protein
MAETRKSLRQIQEEIRVIGYPLGNLWYDWWCSEKALKGREKKFYTIIKGITNDYLLDECYIWFKNNCSCVGGLYDDMRISPLDKGADFNIGIAINSPFVEKEFKYTTFDTRGASIEEFTFETKKDVLFYLNNIRKCYKTSDEREVGVGVNEI